VIIRKSPAEIDAIAAAGAILVRTLRLLERQVRPGRQHRRARPGRRALHPLAGRRVPTFKGYRGFPGSICASPNSMIVHGIPGPYRLERGDVISLDVGVTLDGWVADAARTFPVGPVSAVARTCSRHRALAASRRRAVRRRQPPRRRLARDPGQRRGRRPAVVRSLVGTASGASMHEDPQIPNFGEPGKGPRLQEGMVLAIEPMTTTGGRRAAGEDGWAIYSRTDRSPRTSSSPSRSRPTDRAMLTPWHRDDGGGARAC
jgi:methionyl aminopeptidase